VLPQRARFTAAPLTQLRYVAVAPKLR